MDLKYIIDHVVLPPNLPQEDDGSTDVSRDLILVVLGALKAFRDVAPAALDEKWSTCISMIENMLSTRDTFGNVLVEELVQRLGTMLDGDCLALHIQCQNAGLIVRRQGANFRFEAFELSPKAEAVMGSRGRLRRRFPGPAMTLHEDRIRDARFQINIATFLHQLDSVTPVEAWPVVTKAGSRVVEVRDTINPRFITELFMGMLRALGKPTEAIRVWKSTRDDVLWSNARTPWRRSPLWLLLRVALQTTLLNHDGSSPNELYKSFMLYFHCHVLQLALEESLPSETIYVIIAKLSRRALKLESAEDPSWLTGIVHTTVDSALQELCKRWHTLERGTLCAPRRDSIDSLRDCRLALPKLDNYLQRLDAQPTSSSHQQQFTPSCHKRIQQNHFHLPDTSLSGGESHQLFLADVELWVTNCLDEWLQFNIHIAQSAKDLSHVIHVYRGTATATYAGQPEDFSISLLTLIELWVALDKLAIRYHPLIEDYSPVWDRCLFDPLLLPLKSQMTRLHRVEHYIEQRRKLAFLDSNYVFDDIAHPSSISTRYFNQSVPHQQLRMKIEKDAKAAQARKKADLVSKYQQYSELIQRSDSLSCTYKERRKRGLTRSFHDPLCEKCMLNSRASEMDIDLYEWPLPRSDLQAKAAIFELDVPPVFLEWRDTTYTLLVDVFSPRFRKEDGHRETLYYLHLYTGLKSYVRVSSQRVQIASTAKPFVVSHYKSIKVSIATKESICVNNGLIYAMYDSKESQATQVLLYRTGVQERCTLQLPSGHYRTLQFALNTTNYTSNQALASQDACPEALSLHEYYSFVTLRAGHRLQWHNMARELVSRVLDFKHEAVELLFRQAAWQAGPCCETSIRDSHIALEEGGFGLSLITALEDAITSTEGNWLGITAMSTFATLTVRLLSLSSSPVVQQGCNRLLGRIRQATQAWTRDLARMHHEAEGSEELKDINLRALSAALVCHGTFEIEAARMPELLATDDNVAVLVEAAITIHDRCPTDIGTLPHAIESQLRRKYRLAHSLESALRNAILGSQHAMNNTIRHLWGGYLPGTSWTESASPNSRWLRTETSSEASRRVLVVHYDVLGGSLLVDGLPLTRLPQSYELHENYRRLFKDKILDVVPSSMEGMEFEARTTIHRQQVHFAMINGDLIIRASSNGRIREILPLRVFDGDLPHSFVHDYVHWLDLDTPEIEWRPMLQAWDASPNNWRTITDSSGTRLCRGLLRLVDIRSQTAQIIFQVLRPFELAKHIHIVMDTVSKEIEVKLPRFKLEFTVVQPGAPLQSRQYRGMVVDESQSFGTLTGLQTKLALREKSGRSRLVLVPNGPVSYSKYGNHVTVSISIASGTDIDYHVFRIDEKLGRLVDNGSMKSRLFRIYLHALTSHCLVDTLTGRTGTEEALDNLSAASTLSFLELGAEEVELLEKIATLTPRRDYYPSHLRVMQKVRWTSLPSLSQHASFRPKVARILHHAKSLQIFNGPSIKLPATEEYEAQELDQRQAIRDATFRVDGFGAEEFTVAFDTTYAARDSTGASARETQVCYTAGLVDAWSHRLHPCPHLLSKIESWKTVIPGPLHGAEVSLGFSTEWLEPLSKFLPSAWCALHAKMGSTSASREKYEVMIFLATLSYSQHADQDMVQILLAEATLPSLKILRAPDFGSYDLGKGYDPSREMLIEMARRAGRQFSECPEQYLPPQADEDEVDLDERRRAVWSAAKERSFETFATSLLRQWPTPKGLFPENDHCDVYVSPAVVMREVNVYLHQLYCNLRFRDYIGNIQALLNGLSSVQTIPGNYTFSTPPHEILQTRRSICFADMMANPAPYLGQKPADDLEKMILQPAIVTAVPSPVDDLRASLEAFHRSTSSTVTLSKNDLPQFFQAHFLQQRERCDYVYWKLRQYLTFDINNVSQAAQNTPRITPIMLLSYLRAEKRLALTDEWKMALVQYAISILEVQRAERLLDSSASHADVIAEILNPGRKGWDPVKFPEWLLFEIENNLQIRQEQAEISAEMISPSSKSNTIMQLNMGLGKSSVIVPIVAVALADKTELVRVVVLRSLSKQMFHSLVNKLGNLLDRRVFYMPISRSLELSVHQAQEVLAMYKLCKDCGGILLVQPEHVLSFELMGIDRLLAGDKTGRVIVEAQRWLTEHARDILDESDEILSVRFELVYTMGTQRAVEFGPDRWATIEYVLGLVARAAVDTARQYRDGLEMPAGRPGRFPQIRIIEKEAADDLINRVVEKVCQFGTPEIPLWRLSLRLRPCLLRFLTDPGMTKTAAQPLNHLLSEDASMQKGLLLLRGLFAFGVVRFTLSQKRWRVNYGLDPSRTKLAVPYTAKDIPAARAEFSHPDATVILTCLSYYYGGLSNDQLMDAFEALSRLDNSQSEYEKWTADAPGLNPIFRQLSSINLSNLGECHWSIFPRLHFAKSAIDFYMSHIVFPKHMKEFPSKLSSSGWDIARKKNHPTTGFSGTNDSRYILPLTIAQRDLPQLLATNALTLDRLLRPDNSYFDIEPSAFDANLLLRTTLQLNPPARVIIDAGAQVLELGNEDVARAWLSLFSEEDALAAVFFDYSGEQSVLSRDGSVKRLADSSFFHQLDRCLIYLDQAHTRGTDLKLPTDYRALVTLGPALEKDHLAQACMRMRKLGRGQSVVFCAPSETKHKILGVSAKTKDANVEVLDVLKWAISETFTQTRRSLPLWAAQGLRNTRQNFITSQSTSQDENWLAEELPEEEAQSLVQRYGLEQDGAANLSSIRQELLEDQDCRTRVDAIQTKCRHFGIAGFTKDTTLHEEQERELAPENERERQVERPLPSTPCTHVLHNDVRLLVETGIFRKASKAFQPAFKSLASTSAARYYEAGAWATTFYVSADFANTIKTRRNQSLDFFIRPVHWLMSFQLEDTDFLLVLSPFEVQELLPIVRTKKRVTLHVYSARLTNSSLCLDGLRFCVTPPLHKSWTAPSCTNQLNLFAGQIYLSDYNEYVSLCRFLALCYKALDGFTNVSYDGFVECSQRESYFGGRISLSPFLRSPVLFIRTLFDMRRKGVPYRTSHIGRVLQGELLEEDQL